MQSETVYHFDSHKRNRSRKSQRANDEREARYARVILASVKRELGDAEFFTREDMLQLPVLAHVATITRYQEVCAAVQRLIIERQLVELTRTELCLAGQESRVNMQPRRETYGRTIRKLVTAMPMREPFGVMDVVAEWRSDPHLTINAKRVAVRQELRALVKDDEMIAAHDDFTYTRRA
jgi:hypothetical protein